MVRGTKRMQDSPWNSLMALAMVPRSIWSASRTAVVKGRTLSWVTRRKMSHIFKKQNLYETVYWSGVEGTNEEWKFGFFAIFMNYWIWSSPFIVLRVRESESEGGWESYTGGCSGGASPTVSLGNDVGDDAVGPASVDVDQGAATRPVAPLGGLRGRDTPRILSILRLLKDILSYFLCSYNIKFSLGQTWNISASLFWCSPFTFVFVHTSPGSRQCRTVPLPSRP